jgi:hypothetical protein
MFPFPPQEKMHFGIKFFKHNILANQPRIASENFLSKENVLREVERKIGQA